MASKNIADQFAYFMCEELKNSLKEKLNWELRGPKGWNIGSQSSDITGYALKTHAPLVLIEIERRRYAPVSNVAKVWSWITDLEKKKKLRKRPILIQAFSAHYAKDSSRRKHAKLIGDLMKEAKVADYICLRFKYAPREKAKRCAGACQRQAKRLAGKVVRRLGGRL